MSSSEDTSGGASGSRAATPGESEVMTLRRELDSAIHWALIRKRQPITQNDRKSADDPDFVDMQALDCPYYVPLRGHWGGDWGCIMHPQSEKFGQLVFEHEWCGCGFHSEIRTDMA